MLRVLILGLVLALGAFVCRTAIAQDSASTVEATNRALQAVQRLQDDARFTSQLHDEQQALRGLAAPPPPKWSAPLTAPSLGGNAATSLLEPARSWSATNRQPLLILVSFSMPEADLRELAGQAGRIGAVLVLRGLVDGSFPATQVRLSGFRDIPGAAFQVDPTLFRRFDVQSVPTFILPTELLQACSTTTCPVPGHVRVRGEAGLEHVLEQIRRKAAAPEARASAEQMLKALKARS